MSAKNPGDKENKSITMENLLGHKLNEIEAKYAPPAIYLKGPMTIPLSSHIKISVIGTRHPTDEGIANTKKVVKTLVKNNIIVVSGLAKGIDSTGHKTAIEEGGKTIAVLGTPLNKTYPQENIELQKEIINNHLAVSQYPQGYKTTPKDFALRNRTMALISDAAIIIEAGDASGTLYHGWETIRLKKPLFICKQLVHNPKLKWPQEMIKQGAIELDEPSDIFKMNTIFQPVYIQIVDGVEQLTYNSKIMELNKKYKIRWEGEEFIVIKNNSEVNFYKLVGEEQITG